MKWLLLLFLALLVVGLVIGMTTDQGSGNGKLQINQENNTVVNVTVQQGSTAILPCRVPLGLLDSSATVIWIRRRDLHILTVGVITYTTDARFSVLHPENSQEWELMAKFIQKRDQGMYECQISDDSGIVSMAMLVNLKVVEPKAYILGDYSNYNIEAGSTIKIVCVIQGLTPEYVFWYKNGRILNYDTERGGISVGVNRENDTYTSSELFITAARIEDSGNYTCTSANASPALAKVVVLEDPFVVSISLGSSLDANKIKEGDDVYFECDVDAKLPPRKVIWTHNGSTLSHKLSQGIIITNRSLVLQHVTRNSAGKYACEAQNDIEQATSQPFNLDIKSPQSSSAIPVVSLTLGSSLNPDGIEEGDDVYFECNLTGDPRLYQNSQVSLYHNKRQLTNRDQGISVSKQKLIIQQVKHDQAGNYYCLFDTNEGHFESNTVSLKIQYTDRTIDINDKTPYFINRPLPMQTLVDLNAAPNTTVFTLQARDADKDHDIHYWLVRDRTGGRFEVDEKTGEVRTRGSERFQLDMEYVLYVKAEDQNGRVNASRQRFQLTGDERVAIRNTTSREEYQSTGEERLSIVGGKRPPQFYLSEYEKAIPENLVKGENIITVKAKSFADREIHYSLKALGQGAGTFTIGPTSGIVKLAKELDFEDIYQPHIYQVVVTATEETDGYSTSVNLTIKVAIEGTDVDGYSLKCPSDHNTTSLLEELEQLRQELQHCRQQNGCLDAP